MSAARRPRRFEQNPAWQQLNSQINGTLKACFVSYADYPARLATILAGNDLPDIFCISVLGSLTMSAERSPV